jgi:Sortase domain
MTSGFPGPGRVILEIVEDTDNPAWVRGRVECEAREPAAVGAARHDRLVRRVGGIAAVVVALASALALLVPAAIRLAHHDIGSARGPLQLLTLGAGLFAAGALLGVADFTRWRRTLKLTERRLVTDRYAKAIEQLRLRRARRADRRHLRSGARLPRLGQAPPARDGGACGTHPRVLTQAVAPSRSWLPGSGTIGTARRPGRPAVVWRQRQERNIRPIDLTRADPHRANLTRVRLFCACLFRARLTGATGRPAAAFALAAGLAVIAGGTAGLLLTRNSTPALRPVAAGVAALPAPTGPIVAPPLSADPRPVARPVLLTIPLIGVSTQLVTLGLTSSGALEVPSSASVAGWYTGSAKPGAIGSAIIVGHVDSVSGPGVFFRLSELRAGDMVYVKRSDRTLVEFRVTSVQMYLKDRFPTEAVYGPTPDAELRLITCGGAFDSATGHYLSNIVVYATEAS